MVSLDYGWGGVSLAYQLNQQGLMFKDEATAERFEKLRKAVMMLFYNHFLTQNETQKVIGKINKQISDNIQALRQ